MYYFGDFGATYLFSMPYSVLSAPIIFLNIYICHCYIIANTPIFQSRSPPPPVLFPDFLEGHSYLSVPHTPSPLLMLPTNMHNSIPSLFLCFRIAKLSRTSFHRRPTHFSIRNPLPYQCWYTHPVFLVMTYPKLRTVPKDVL